MFSIIFGLFFKDLVQIVKIVNVIWIMKNNNVSQYCIPIFPQKWLKNIKYLEKKMVESIFIMKNIIQQGRWIHI